jgi:hypothetical protein
MFLAVLKYTARAKKHVSPAKNIKNATKGHSVTSSMTSSFAPKRQNADEERQKQTALL